MGRRSLIVVAALLVPRLVFAQTAFSNRRPGDPQGYTFQKVQPSAGSTVVADGPTDLLQVLGTAPVKTTGTITGLLDTLTISLDAPPTSCSANQLVTNVGANMALSCTSSVTMAQNGTGSGSPSAASSVVVSTGSGTAAWKALTDCDDTGGNHVNFDTATNTFSCGTSSSSGTAPTLYSTTCSSTAINSTSGVTVITYPTFSTSGKTTWLSGSLAITNATGGTRTYTATVKQGASNVAAFSQFVTANQQTTLNYAFVETGTNCTTSCSFTVVVTSDVTTATQTLTACGALRITY